MLTLNIAILYVYPMIMYSSSSDPSNHIQLHYILVHYLVLHPGCPVSHFNNKHHGHMAKIDSCTCLESPLIGWGKFLKLSYLILCITVFCGVSKIYMYNNGDNYVHGAPHMRALKFPTSRQHSVWQNKVSHLYVKRSTKLICLPVSH